MRWIFNTQMVWGAVLGYLIFSGLGQLRDTWQHKGWGYITYEDPGGTVKVPEHQYKRERYTDLGFLLVISGGFWIIVAHEARDKDK